MKKGYSAKVGRSGYSAKLSGGKQVPTITGPGPQSSRAFHKGVGMQHQPRRFGRGR